MILRCTAQASRPRGASGAHSRRNAVSPAGRSLKASAGRSVSGAHSSFSTDLPQHVEKFGFIIGVQRRTFRDQDPVNIEASELIARLHDALKASGYDGHDLERFLVRIVFCLFADDTGIFEPREIFLQFVEERTAADGADLGPWMARLFQVLNTPPSRRKVQIISRPLVRPLGSRS